MSGGNTARARRVAIAGAIAAVTVALYGADHIRLVNEGSSGPLYECTAAACTRAQTDNPSRQNLDQMDFYVLPDGCVALASAALRPAAPGIDVECGPTGATKRYRCESASCRLLDPADPGDGAITRPVLLPADCGGRIHELIVVGARTDRPAIFVECDASSGPARAQ
jgi:hypothetical protein